MAFVLSWGLPIETRAQARSEDGAHVDSGTTATTPTREDRFGGSFRYIGGQRERTNLATAIDITVEEVAWVIQGIVRRRLTEANPIPKTTTIVFQSGKIAVQRSGQKTLAAPADGSVVKWTSEYGDRANARFRWRGEKLIQHVWNNDGGNEVTYSLSQDGTRLHVNVRMYADRLPVPVRYRLTYARTN